MSDDGRIKRTVRQTVRTHWRMVIGMLIFMGIYTAGILRVCSLIDTWVDRDSIWSLLAYILAFGVGNRVILWHGLNVMHEQYKWEHDHQDSLS